MSTFTNRILLKGDDRTKAAFGSVRRNINAVGKAVVGFSAISATVFGVMGKRALDAADRVGKLSKQLGVSTEFLSQMSHAAQLTGTNFESFSRGMSQLERNVVNANEGMSTQIRAFERVGVSAEQLKGLKPEDIFDRVADAIAGIEDPTVKSATAMDLFGRAGRDMIPLLNEGADGMRRMREQADALGLTLDEEQTSAAERANDAITKLMAGVQGATNTLILHFAPAIQAVAEFLATKVPLSIKQAQAAFVILRRALVDSVVGILEVLRAISFIPTPLGKAVRAQLAALGDVSNMIETLTEQSKGYTKEIDDLIKSIGDLSFKLNAVVPDSGDAADGIREISVSAKHLVADTTELSNALEFLADKEITINKLTSDRVLAELALIDVINEAQKVIDEETEALKRQEEQAKATAQAFDQLFQAVGSLNQTFGLGLTSLQGEGVAQALQSLGVSPGTLGTFAAGAQGGESFGGQALGGIGAVVGSAFGPIGSAIGSFIGQTIGDALFGPNGPRDSEIIIGSGAINSRGNQDPQDTRLGGTFVDALIRDSNRAFADEFLGPAVQAAEGFFNLVEQVLSPEQLATATSALEGRRFTIRPEDVEGGRFLEPILDAIVDAMSPTVQRFVGQFEGIEAQLEAFAAINLTMQALEADPIQLWADALADADRTALQVLRDMDQQIGQLGRTAFDSIDDMIGFGESVQAFNRQFVQFMAGIEQARRNIGAGAEDTIQGLRFTALEGNPIAQFEFLTRRANQLGAGIGGLGSAQEVEQTVAMINQLLTQAFGLATAEQRQQLLPLFEDTIRSAEEEAQARLDELQAEAEAIAQERREQIDRLLEGMNESSTSIIDAADRFGVGGDRVLQAAQKVEAGGNAILQGASIITATPIQVSFGRTEITG